VAPKKSSRILELSDGSDDNNNNGNDDDNGNDDNEEPEESAKAELGQFNFSCYNQKLKIYSICIERLSKEWNLPIYVFFKPMPSIKYIKGRRVHIFECAATHCKGKGNGCFVRRYLDTGDAKSSGNLHKHAKGCWGEEAIAATDNTKDI